MPPKKRSKKAHKGPSRAKQTSGTAPPRRESDAATNAPPRRESDAATNPPPRRESDAATNPPPRRESDAATNPPPRRESDAATNPPPRRESDASSASSSENPSGQSHSHIPSQSASAVSWPEESTTPSQQNSASGSILSWAGGCPSLPPDDSSQRRSTAESIQLGQGDRMAQVQQGRSSEGQRGQSSGFLSAFSINIPTPTLRCITDFFKARIQHPQNDNNADDPSAEGYEGSEAGVADASIDAEVEDGSAFTLDEQYENPTVDSEEESDEIDAQEQLDFHDELDKLINERRDYCFDEDDFIDPERAREAIGPRQEEVDIMLKLDMMKESIQNTPRNMEYAFEFLDKVSETVKAATKYLRERGDVQQRDVNRVKRALRGVVNPVVVCDPQKQNRIRYERRKKRKAEQRHEWERSQSDLIRDAGQTAIVIEYMKNQRFTLSERFVLATLWAVFPEVTCKLVAKEIAHYRSTPIKQGHCDVGAVEYEKKRFEKIKEETGGCDPVAIHRDFIKNKRKAGAKCVIDDDPYLALDVIDYIMDHRSAAKISKYLRDRDENPIRLWSQAIQQWICKEHNRGSIICQFIPQRARPRGVNRRNENTGIIPIPDLKSFREKDFLDLWVYGQWEIDTAFGANHSGVLCCCIEKRTRYGIIILLKNKNSRPLCQAMAQKLSRFHCQTIVADRGSEFFYHRIFYEALRAQTYFCDAGRPQQKGQVESFIGRIRYFLPKGTDFTHLTHEHVQRIQDLLNSSKMEVLGWQCPNDLVHFIEKSFPIITEREQRLLQDQRPQPYQPTQQEQRAHEDELRQRERLRRQDQRRQREQRRQQDRLRQQEQRRQQDQCLEREQRRQQDQCLERDERPQQHQRLEREERPQQDERLERVRVMNEIGEVLDSM